MIKRFCPKCGVTISSGTFCESCKKEKFHYETPLIQVSEFQRTWYKGSWHLFSHLDVLIRKRVQEAIGKKVEMEIEPYIFIPKPKEKIIVTVKAIIDEEEMELPVRVSYRQCDYGQKSKTEYFEGILQLRNPTPEVQNFIEIELKKVSSKGSFITRTVEVKNGVDLYFTDKNRMRLIAQKVHVRFGGIIKINPQLFSHNHLSSKDLYRLNVFVKLPEFKVGDVISYVHTGTKNKDETVQYVQVQKMGKTIQARNIILAKPVSLEMRFAKDIKIIPIQKSIVASSQPELTIIDPNTFQAERVVNANTLMREYVPDQNIELVYSDFGWCIIE